MSYEEKPNKKLDELLKHVTVCEDWRDYCKAREEVNKGLNGLDKLEEDYQDLEYRYSILEDFILKMSKVLEGNFDFLQPSVKETKLKG